MADMEISSRAAWSYSEDGIDLNIWNSNGQLVLLDAGNIVGRFATVDLAVEAAVNAKKTSGFSVSKLEHLFDLSHWQSISQGKISI